MPTKCQFKFSRPTPIYYSGEQISGSIILSTTKQLPVEAIQLSLVGYERVQWLERSKDDLLLHNDSIDKDNNVIFNGKRGILCESHTLAKRVRLLPGEVLVEEFCFTLPNDAQASCTMKYGEVVYKLQLTLQRKSIFNKVFKARITVKNRLDLNDIAELVKPCETLNIKDASSSIDKPLHFALHNGTGYVPGQSIAYTLQGKHKFGACKKLLVNLCQRSTFHATSPEIKIKELCMVLKSSVQKLSLSSYVNVKGQLNIPLTTRISKNVSEGDLIQTRHYVEAMLICKRRILQKFIIPILVGTVPLRKSSTQMEEESVDYNHCYDNLATDDDWDKTSENGSIKSESHTFSSTLPSELIYNTWTTSSSNMLQQHVPTKSNRITLCKADICHHTLPLELRNECPV